MSPSIRFLYGDRKALLHPARSGFILLSPRGVSRKREFSWIRLETFGSVRPKSSNIGLQRLLAMRKARIWRAFLIQRKKFSETRNAWLGREDSNLRMGESK